MYDPVIGRVLSPDKFVQSPGYTQSYNRYSYCMNNPLKYTDPSGWYALADMKARYNWEGAGFWYRGSYQQNTSDGWVSWNPSFTSGTGWAMGATPLHYDPAPGSEGYTKIDDKSFIDNGTGNVVPFETVQTNFVQSNGESIELLFGGTPEDPYQFFNGYRTIENSSAYLHKASPQSIKAYNEPGGKWDLMGVGSVPYHGNAWFGTNFVGPGPDGPNANPYSLKDNFGKIIKPIDAIDAAAQRHDYSYWQNGASGVEGAIFNKYVTSADILLAANAYYIMQGFAAGAIDPVTKLPISDRTDNIARGIYFLFTTLVLNKLIH